MRYKSSPFAEDKAAPSWKRWTDPEHTTHLLQETEFRTICTGTELLLSRTYSSLASGLPSDDAAPVVALRSYVQSDTRRTDPEFARIVSGTYAVVEALVVPLVVVVGVSVGSFSFPPTSK